MKISQLLAERDGAHWIELDTRISFLVNSIENGKFYSVFDRIKHRKILTTKEKCIWLSEEFYEKYRDYQLTTIDQLPEQIKFLIEAEMISKYVLIDWKGITDNENNEIEYSKDIAVNIIAYNRRIRNFFRFDSYYFDLYPNEELKVSGLILEIASKFLVEQFYEKALSSEDIKIKTQY